MLKKNGGNKLIRHFHISRNIREKYGLKNSLFKLSGETVQMDFKSIRELTAKLNEESSKPLFASEIGSIIPQTNASCS